MKRFSYLIPVAGLIFTFLFLAGCKQKGCTDPNAINYESDAEKDNGTCIYNPSINLNIDVVWGADPFSYGSDYALANGRRVSLDIARFYISNLYFEDAQGREEPVTTDYLQFVPNQKIYGLGRLSAGNYTKLVFDIGVPGNDNLSDPASWPDDHALSSSSSTLDHWNWTSGYVFMKLEGRCDTTASMTGATDRAITYHIGTSQFIRRIELLVNLSVEQDGSGEVNLEVDLQKLFDGVDLTQDFDTHTMNNIPLATTIADNFLNAIVSK